MTLRDQVHRWTNCQFSLRSGYYAGRPPTTSDINQRILEMFYSGIKKDVSPEAATNFVRLIIRLKDLSASAFIVAFERFAGNNYTLDEIAQSSADRIALSSGDEMYAEGMAVIAIKLTSERLDEEAIERISFHLKYDFIKAHLAELSKSEHESALAF